MPAICNKPRWRRKTDSPFLTLPFPACALLSVIAIILAARSTCPAKQTPVSAHTHSRKGIIAVGLFLFFGAAMASFAGMTLVWPGTILDRAWSLNPNGFTQLSAVGRIIGVPFLILACALAVAGVGWFGHRRWAWWLTVIIIATQVVGGLVHLLTRHFLEGSVALVVSSALLVYLTRPATRSVFAK